jgi:hypothetical protein
VSTEASAEDAVVKGFLVGELKVNVTSGNEAAISGVNRYRPVDSHYHAQSLQMIRNAFVPPACSGKFWEEYTVRCILCDFEIVRCRKEKY